MRAAAFWTVVLLLGATAALAQQGPKSRPVPQPPSSASPTAPPPGRQQVNIAGSALLGETAPDFELDGSMGKPVKLSRLRGDWVVLVFAERREHLADLGAKAGDLRQLGGVFLGVCDEKAGAVIRQQQSDPLPFPVAADPTGEVSALYGVFDRIHTTTTPGFFVLDRHSVVRLAVIGQSVPADDIMELARLTITTR